MSYAGSCLDERTWRAALAGSVAQHQARAEHDLRTGVLLPQADPALEARAGQWLIDLSGVDPAYAEWASHHYEKLGALQTSDAPLFKNFPARLQRQINLRNAP